MRVKYVCGVFLLVFVCAFSEEQRVNENRTEEIEAEVKIILDNVVQQKAQCTSDADCHHLGTCDLRGDGSRSCNCKAGTSGESCERVDDCVDNPVKCGELDDVACVYDVRLEKAVCKCDNVSKTYVVDEERCMSPCTRGDQCGMYGSCMHEVGDQKFCACELGAAGDYCDVITACENGDVDCGDGKDVECALTKEGRAWCKCEDFGKRSFDAQEKICKECYCGPHATNCEFKDNKKACTCKDGYIQDSSDGICTQMCNVTHKCQNGGVCTSSRVCRCLKGTNGDMCQNVEDCAKCGGANCLFNVTSLEPYCQCSNPRQAFDEFWIICRECNCGSYSKGCTFVDGKKKCKCLDAYEDKLGECALCFCKGYSSMNGCRFDDFGHIVCNCIKGYAQLGDECKKCDCGGNGKCSLSGWGKTCSCDKGHTESGGICKACDCGEHGNCYFRNTDKVCYCNKGFEDYEGTCKECDCGDHSTCKFDPRGWKICTCNKGYAMRNEQCTECNCYPGEACEYHGLLLTDKECMCPHCFADYLGSCNVCDCGMDDSNCTLNGVGGKRCLCPLGYEEKKNFLDASCQDVDECAGNNDCPYSARCVNTPGSYNCVCRDGYEMPWHVGDYDVKERGCVDIDECAEWSACTDMFARCVNTPGSYKCECRMGYAVRKGLTEKQNSCDEVSRPWRTATIVLGCLSGIVIIGLLFGICHKHAVFE